MVTAYGVALSDWLSRPVIHGIERKDGRTLIEATDKVMVTNVQVTVLGEEGQALEKGEAARIDGDWREYIPTSEGKTIVAEASDLAGNVTRVVA